MTDTTFSIGNWRPEPPVREVFTLDRELGKRREGTRFYTGTMAALINRLVIPPREGRMIAVCNVHMFVTAGKDAALAAAMRGAAFALCDGKPIAWLLSLMTGRGVARVTGPDVFQVVLREHLGRARVALVGGNASVLEQLRANVPEHQRANLLLLDPGRVAEGDGPSEAVFAALEAFRPGIVFVGLGCPKQEKWIARAVSRVPAHFLGVGAAFDYGTGAIRRAPRAMQAAGAEWLFRLAQQPRLARRYFGTLLPFLAILGQAASYRAGLATRDLAPAVLRRGKLGV